MNKTEPVCSRVKCPPLSMTLEKKRIQQQTERLLCAHIVLATGSVKADKVSFPLLPRNWEVFWNIINKSIIAGMPG